MALRTAALRGARTVAPILRGAGPSAAWSARGCTGARKAALTADLAPLRYLLGGGAAGAALSLWTYWQSASAPGGEQVVVQATSAVEAGPGDWDDQLPEYTADEVAAHRSKDTGIWVTYGNGVYNVRAGRRGDGRARNRGDQGPWLRPRGAMTRCAAAAARRSRTLWTRTPVVRPRS